MKSTKTPPLIYCRAQFTAFLTSANPVSQDNTKISAYLGFPFLDSEVRKVRTPILMSMMLGLSNSERQQPSSMYCRPSRHRLLDMYSTDNT